MVRPEKWADFTQCASISKPHKIHGQWDVVYAVIQCPYACGKSVEVPAANVKKHKASECHAHLMACSGTSEDGKKAADDPRVCVQRKAAVQCKLHMEAAKQGIKTELSDLPTETAEPPKKRHQASTFTKGDEIVTIYALIYLPTGERVYTGRTKDPDRRLAQHAAKGSKCRLVRNAFRKYGRKSFGLEPILRCRASDADANESFWIIENKTLYPDGYNLRHGSNAGEEDDDSLATALVPTCTGVIPFTGIADETRACAEGWEDVAEIVDGVDETKSEAYDLCNDFLRQVHPDAHGGETRAYSADEVAAMLNAVREAVS